MDEQDIVHRGALGLASHEIGEQRMGEDLVDRSHPVRRLLGMAGRRRMKGEDGVGEEEGGHRGLRVANSE